MRGNQMEKSETGNKIKLAGIKLAVILFWILVWEIISRIIGIEFLVPSVSIVISTLTELVLTRLFWQITITSIYRILVGFFLGSVVGTLLAILTAKSKIIYEFFIPVLSIIKATPIVSFIILALVWIKGGNIPSFISFLMVLPIVWGNVYEAIGQTDGKLLEMAKIYQIPNHLVIKRIYFHSVLPYFGAAATTSMGLAWKAGIAAEVIATPRFSIGTAIYDSKIYLETSELFAWSIIVILLSVLLEKGVIRLLKRFTPVSEKYKENERDNYKSDNIVSKTLSGDLAKTKTQEDDDTENILINLTDITVDYESINALENFSASFPRNGCVCLFGPSGCGKTTLINVIAGLKKPAGGDIRFAEKKPEKIAYVFQEDRLIPWISAEKNVEIVLKKNMHADSIRKAREILEKVGLQNATGKLPDELSGGMKQRVNIARALAFDASVILLDEPFKGLDLKIKKQVIDIFKNQKKEKLLILITHDTEEIKLLADSVIYFS